MSNGAFKPNESGVLQPAPPTKSPGSEDAETVKPVIPRPQREKPSQMETRWASKVMQIASWICIGFMCVLLLMGLMMMLTGVLCFISDHVGSQQLSSDHVTSASDKCLGWCLHPKQERSVVNLLKGLEYFFLAPLGYLLTRSLAIYIRSVQNNRMGYPDQMSVAALMAVKGLMVALVIAVLSTHLIGGFILSEGTEFDHMKTLCGGIVLLVLILYFKILETSSRQELPPKPTGHVTPETEERRNKVKQQFQSLGLDSW